MNFKSFKIIYNVLYVLHNKKTQNTNVARISNQYSASDKYINNKLPVVAPPPLPDVSQASSTFLMSPWQLPCCTKALAKTRSRTDN